MAASCEILRDAASRPQMLQRFPATIGYYEMSVMPKSLFAIDGSLLKTILRTRFMLYPSSPKPSQHAYVDMEKAVETAEAMVGEIDLGHELEKMIIFLM